MFYLVNFRYLYNLLVLSTEYALLLILCKHLLVFETCPPLPLPSLEIFKLLVCIHIISVDLLRLYSLSESWYFDRSSVCWIKSSLHCFS